jgi:tetratricopeptide (TPR) repeat protein
MSMIATLLLGIATSSGLGGGAVAGNAADVALPARNAPLALTPEQMFVLAEQLTLAHRLREAISILVPLTNNRSADYRAEARARIARLYLALGEKRQAAAWFQKLLDEKPGAAAVRIELANVLLELNDSNGARRQFRRAAASRGLPDDVARALGRAGAALLDSAPVQVSMRVGLAPNTNVNYATQAQTVDIYGLPFTLSQSARAQSGVGLISSGDIVVQHRLDASSRLIAEISTDGTFYRNSTFNDVALTGSLGPEIASQLSLFHPAIVIGERWYGAQRLYTLYGLSLAIRQALSNTAQASLTVSESHLDYAYRPDLSGQVSSAGLAYERALSPRTSLRLGLTASRMQASDPAQSTYSAGIDGALSRDVGRFIAFSRLGFSRTIGDAPFSYLGVGRNDTLGEAELGLIYKRISLWGFSPQLRVKYTQNRSPVAFYAYRQTRFELSLAKTF